MTVLKTKPSCQEDDVPQSPLPVPISSRKRWILWPHFSCCKPYAIEAVARNGHNLKGGVAAPSIFSFTSTDVCYGPSPWTGATPHEACSEKKKGIKKKVSKAGHERQEWAGTKLWQRGRGRDQAVRGRRCVVGKAEGRASEAGKET